MKDAGHCHSVPVVVIILLLFLVVFVIDPVLVRDGLVHCSVPGHSLPHDSTLMRILVSLARLKSLGRFQVTGNVSALIPARTLAPCPEPGTVRVPD